MNSTKRVALVLALLGAAVAGGVQLASAGNAGSLASVATDCSIDQIAIEYGFTMGSAPQVDAAVSSKAIGVLQGDNPDAVVVEERTARLTSGRLPTISGHVGLILRFDGAVPAIPAGTPTMEELRASEPSIPSCNAPSRSSMRQRATSWFRSSTWPPNRSHPSPCGP